MDTYRVTPEFLTVEVEGESYKVEELTLEQHDELGDLQERYNNERSKKGWTVANEVESMREMCGLLAPEIPHDVIDKLRPRH